MISTYKFRGWGTQQVSYKSDGPGSMFIFFCEWIYVLPLGNEFVFSWKSWLFPFKKNVFGFTGSSQVSLVGKNLPANAGDIRDASSIPGLGRSPGVGHGNPLQYSCLANPMNRGAWWVTSSQGHRVGHSWNDLALTHALDLTYITWDLWSLWIFSYGIWDLGPWPGIKPWPPALGVWSLSHWIFP